MSLVIEYRPVKARIASVIEGRLEMLMAGYSNFFTIEEVFQPTRQGDYTPSHNQIVLTYGPCERVEELDVPGNPSAICWAQTFHIRVHVMPSEQDPTPINEILDTYAAEVQRVLTNPGTMWYSMGGLCINCEFQPIENYAGENGICGFNFPIVCTFRTDESNPFVVRS